MIDNPRPGDRVALRFFYQGSLFEWVEGEVLEAPPNVSKNFKLRAAMVRTRRGDLCAYFDNLFTIEEGLRLALEDAAK
jgi:hypothetical protein